MALPALPLLAPLPILAPLPPLVDPIQIDKGDDFVQCKMPLDVMTGPGGAAALARVVVALRAYDVPVIGASVLISVRSGTLHTMCTKTHVVYRWRF